MPLKKLSDIEPPKDTDIFPFGKAHKGKTYEEVPASYLHWCRHNVDNLPADVQAYIDHNMMALQEETPDLIWSK